MTPFGLPVEPLVYMMMAIIRSGWAGHSRNSFLNISFGDDFLEPDTLDTLWTLSRVNWLASQVFHDHNIFDARYLVSVFAEHLEKLAMSLIRADDGGPLSL